MNTAATDTARREIVITRLVNAHRELVWKVWTRAEHIQYWWGPDGFTNTIQEMEVKPGGTWRFIMHGPDGTDYPNKIVFTEVIKPERLAYTHSADDENDPHAFRTTVLFEAKDEKTLVTLRALFTTAAEKERVLREQGAEEGGRQTLKHLDEYVQAFSSRPVIIERLFDAPVDKVWKALTDKDEMKNWYFDLAAFTPVTGFSFQFYGQGHKGEQYLHLCEITEVSLHKKIAYTWMYQGYKGVSEVSFELFDEQGKTRLRLTHAGLTSFPAANPDFAESSFREGWTQLIHISLENYLSGK